MGPRAIALALTLLCASTLCAQAPSSPPSHSPSHLRAADRLLEAMSFDQYLQSEPKWDALGIPFVTEMMNNPEVRKQLADVQLRLQKGLPVIRARVGRYLAGKYSERELGELRKLFLTPHGTKFMKQKFDLDMEIGLAALDEVFLQMPEIKKMLQGMRDMETRRKTDWTALLARADAGEAAAQVQVANRYCGGNVPEARDPPNRPKCREYRERAAEQGSAEAMYALGMAHLQTHPQEPRQPVKAVEWLAKAAEKNHPHAGMLVARLKLGFGAFDGGSLRPSGMPEVIDIPGGEALMRSLALAGNATAQMTLGDAYLSGSAVAKNPALAAEVFRLAADKGNRLAMQRLGDLYFAGEGVPRDADEALRWYRLSLGKK